MKILFILLISFPIPFIMLLKNYRLTKKELLIAESVRELLRIENKYFKMVSQNKFSEYPCMQKYIYYIVHLNLDIASNFCTWFDEFKVKPLRIRDALKSEDYKRLFDEYKNCRDEDVINLFKQRDELFFKIYAFKHPVRQVLWRIKCRMIFLLVTGAAYILSTTATVTEGSQKNTEIISDYKTVFGSEQIRIVS